MATKREILLLYKNCMNYINGLKYSDKDYLKNRVRDEFRKNEASKYNKGLAFIRRDQFA